MQPIIRIIGVMLLSVANGPLVAQIPVEGDTALLKQIRNSNSAHEKSLKHGKWQGTVTRDGDQGKISFAWDGAKSRIDYDIKKSSLIQGRGESGFAIRTDKAQLILFDSARKANHYEGVGRSFYPPMECHPQNSWYTFQELLPWSRLLDHEKPQGSVVKFTMAKDPAGNILINRLHADGTTFQIVCSQQLDNRIIKYSTIDAPPGTTEYSGEIDWALTVSGKYYPKHFRNWQCPAGAEKGDAILDMVIDNFSSEKIDEQVFRMNRSNLPSGTKVQTFNKDGSKREQPAILP